MRPDCFAHLSDPALVRDYAVHRARRQRDTATELAYLGEIDARRLYRQAARQSMYSHCVEDLHFSEDSAYKHIRAARAARRYPAILDGVAGGKLHLSAVVLLAPYLTTENLSDLLAMATHRSKAQIEAMLAARFPRPDLPERIDRLDPGPPATQLDSQLAPGPVHAPMPAAVPPRPAVLPEVHPMQLDSQLAPGPVELPARIPSSAQAPKVKPLAPQRFALQATIDQGTHDDLRRAQELLRHQLPDGNVSEVLKRALRLLVGTLEKRKFGLAERPRAAARKPGTESRHIPAHVRRTVWKRDAGRCTFVSESGHRCESREWLEYDHEFPVGRGGRSTTGNLRLRCRAHNQLEAERTYGAEFMRHKRASAREAADRVGKGSRAG